MLYHRNHLLYRLLDAFFRHWPVFVMAVFGVTAVVAASLIIRSESYTAAAAVRVIPDSDVAGVMGFTKHSWETPAGKNSARFGDMLQDRRKDGFVSTVLQTADLKTPINLDPQAEDPRFRQFYKSVYVGAQSSDVFSIGLTWPDKDECERLVAALRDTYIKQSGDDRRTQSIETGNYLDSEITRYRGFLKKAEDALVQYKIKNAGQLPDAQIAALEQFANLRMERDYLSITSQDNALKSAALAQRIATIKPTAILEQTIGNDPVVQELRSLEAKRSAHVNSGYTETGTLARDMDRQIRTLKQRIAAQQKIDPTQQRNITETKLQDNPEYMGLTQQLTEAKIAETTQKARMALLDNTLAEYEVRIAALPANERILTERTRDYTLLKEQFEDLLKRRQQVELKANLENIMETSTLLEQNVVYAEPTTGKTKKALMLVGSLIVGLVIGFGIILLREWMDPSLRYETDAARLLGVPVLAGLPEHSHLRFPAIQAKKMSFIGRRESPPFS